MRAIESDFTAAVKSLVETLGKGLVAVIVDRDVKTVARWMAGAIPRDEEQRRVVDTLQICELLLSGDAPSVVRSWFMGMNPQLNDENPAEVATRFAHRRATRGAGCGLMSRTASPDRAFS